MREQLVMRWLLNWRKAFVFLLIFVAGVASVHLARHVSHWWLHRVYVATIHGTKDKGCGGSGGYNYMKLGRPYGQDDGFYEVPCGEHFWPSDDVALFCDCR